jgi:hypothetical protein
MILIALVSGGKVKMQIVFYRFVQYHKVFFWLPQVLALNFKSRLGTGLLFSSFVR